MSELVVAHVADLHLSNERLAEKERCAEQLLTQISNQDVDLIAVAGDIYDRSIRLEEPGARAGVRLFSNFADIAPVIAIKGNFSHDRDSIDILPYARGRFGIRLATEPGVFLWHGGENCKQIPVKAVDITTWRSMERSIPPLTCDAAFFAMPYPGAGYLAQWARLSPDAMKQAISEQIKEIVRGFGGMTVSRGAPRILLFHGTIIGAQFSAQQQEIGMDIELSPATIAECGFSAVLAGHLHYCQEIEPHIFYPGGLCCTHYDRDDQGPKGAWLHTFDGDKLVESRHLTVQARKMITVDIDFSSPFFTAPPVGDADVRIALKRTDADRERAVCTDWTAIFPGATSIDVLPTVEQVESVRCEAVRSVHHLRDKVRIWGEQSDSALITEPVLNKAELLESMTPDQLLESVRVQYATRT